MKPVISILGCGWLGFPLAKHLVSLGFTVKGSTTTPAKLQPIQHNRILPFLIECDPEVRGDRVSEFFQSDIVFLNIPFKRNLEDPKFYYQQIQSVANWIAQSPVKFVIFASSTSIYPQSLKLADEHISFVPDNQRSQVLFEAEQLLMQAQGFDTTIIRFAGLFGGERVGKTSFKDVVEDSDQPMNVIHLDDCIEIVTQIIKRDIRNEIFNACADKHPTRKEFYMRRILKHREEMPIFKDAQSKHQRIVSNDQLKQVLNYQLKYPDPLNFPELL